MKYHDTRCIYVIVTKIKNGHAFLQHMRLNVITGYCDSKYFCLTLHFCNACSNRYVYCQNIDT